jgi:molybdopterin-guanine dinucleotide biosynthesis protein A
MGYDKANMLIDGVPIIEKTADSLKRIFNEIIICGRPSMEYVPTGARYVEDMYRDIGPIAGIYTGLYCSNEDINFITACDIPDININIIKLIRENLDGHDAAVIKTGEFYEPLFGFYNRRTLHIFEESIKNQVYKISDVFKHLDIKYILDEEIRGIEPGFRGLYNINTQDDLKKYIKEAKDKP